MDTTYLKPSQLVPGHRVGSGTAGYTVTGLPIQERGEIVVPCQYIDGGMGERVFDCDEPMVPVLNGNER